MYEEYEDIEYKGKERAKKVSKRKTMMRINGRGLKSVVLPLLEKKASKSNKRDDSE